MDSLSLKRGHPGLCLSALLMVLLSGCIAPRYQSSSARSIHESSTLIKIGDKIYMRHILLVRGIHLTAGRNPLADIPGPNNNNDKQIRWLPFGVKHEDRLQQEYIDPSGKVNTENTHLFSTKDLQDAAQLLHPPQLPLLLKREEKQETKWYVPMGAHALYFVGCILPKSAEDGSDPTIQTTLGPKGTDLGRIKVNRKLSEVRWIWEVIPEFTTNRDMHYQTGLSMEGNKYVGFLERDKELAQRPGGNCALLSGAQPTDAASWGGMSLQFPNMLADLNSAEMDFIPISREEELRIKSYAFMRDNLIPGFLAALALLHALPNDLASSHWLESIGLTSALSTVLFQRIGIMPFVSDIVRKSLQKNKIEAVEKLVKEVQETLSSVDDANKQALAVRKLINTYNATFQGDTTPDVDVFYETRKKAIVEVLLSRIFTLAQELGERHFYHWLLHFQRNLSSFKKPPLTPFDIQLMQMDPQVIRLMVKNENSQNALLNRQKAAEQKILNIFAVHPFEVMLFLQEALLEVMNTVNFDFGNFEDIKGVIGDGHWNNDKQRNLLQRESEQNLNLPFRQQAKHTSPTLFQIFMEWQFIAQESVAAALPALPNQIFVHNNQQRVQPITLDPEEADLRTKALAEVLGVPVNETLNVTAKLYESFQKLYKDIDFLPFPYEVQPYEVQPYELETKSLPSDDLPAVWEWIENCNEENRLLCIGGRPESSDSQASALRIQAVVNLFIRSLLDGQRLESAVEETRTLPNYANKGAIIFKLCTNLTKSAAACRWSGMEGWKQAWE
jgi:hypothetical protein